MRASNHNSQCTSNECQWKISSNHFDIWHLYRFWYIYWLIHSKVQVSNANSFVLWLSKYKLIETIKRFEQKKFEIDGGTGSIGKSLIDASSFLLSNKFYEVIKSINIPNIRYLDEKISFLHLESINGPFLDPKRWISFSQNLVYWKVTLIKAASPSSLWNLSPFVAHLPFVCLYATIMYDGAILCWNFKINTMIDSQCKVSADKYMSKRTRLLELFIVRSSSVNKSIEHILTSSQISSKVWNGTSTLDWRIASHSLRHNFQLMYSMCVCVCMSW